VWYGETHVLRCPNMIELLLEHIGVDLAEDTGQALQLSLLRRQGRLIGGGEGSEAQDREEGEFDQHFGTSLAAHAIRPQHIRRIYCCRVSERLGLVHVLP